MATPTSGRKYAATPADIPRGTLTELFFHAIEIDKADALREKVDGRWRSISHAEVLERVRRTALALEALGLQRGDRVAIMSENRPEWALADYASLCAGLLDVPVYATLPPNQISYILRDSGARLVFCSTCDQLAKVESVWDELPGLERAVVFDEGCSEDPRVMTFSALLALGAEREAAGAGADFRERALAVSPDDVATLIYTSGTTGEPKGVMLTHNNLASNVEATQRVILLGKDDIALSFLPLSHVLQRMVDYYLFGHGSTIAYVSSLDLVPLALVEVKPTITVSTPRVYEKVYAKVMSATGIKRTLVMWARRVAEGWTPPVVAGEQPPASIRLQHAIADVLVYKKIRARMGGRLRFFVSGGGPLAPHIARFFYGAGVLILEGYGLTETSPVTNVNTPEDFTIGTVGKPLPGTEEMIAEDGEILVRGPQVMKGYFNKPGATAEAIDADGWFRTGDIGELDETAHLKITDRKKEIIVTAGGKNIAPQPIENLAKTSRYVSEAVMIGDRRPYPVLLVVPNWEPLEVWARQENIFFRAREDLIRNREVQAKVEEDIYKRFGGLARFETPKKIAILAHDFSIERDELTPTLKVRRRIVEKHYAPVIEQLYEQPASVAAE